MKVKVEFWRIGNPCVAGGQTARPGVVRKPGKAEKVSVLGMPRRSKGLGNGLLAREGVAGKPGKPRADRLSRPAG